jgi:hypothetical protein
MQNQRDSLSDNIIYALSVGKTMVRRNRVRMALAVVLLYGLFHYYSFGVPSGETAWTSYSETEAEADPSLALFPPMPSDIERSTSPPILTSRPDPDTVFSRHHHEHPYAGVAQHLSSSIHPSKDILDETHYTLGSAWFFEQDGNLDWMSIGVQGLLPTSAKHIVFTCEYIDSASGRAEEVMARTKLQGRKEYIHVECPLPAQLQIDKTLSEREIRQRLEKFRLYETRIKAWMVLAAEGEDEDADPWQKWRTARPGPGATVVLDADTGSSRVLAVTQKLVEDDWEHSKTGNKLGICLSPLRLHNGARDKTDDLVNQLKDFVEWRIWHRYEGVEVVHWAARDPKFGPWVEKMNRVLGLHDTFLAAPSAFHTNDGHRNNYGDQLLYLADCLMRHGVTDEWLAMTDTDEYLTPRDDPSPYGTVRRLESLDENIGTFSAPHTYYGLNRVKSEEPYGPPAVAEFPQFPRNAWRDWDTMEKSDGWRREKSIYRTAVAKSIWVHSHTELGRGFWRTADAPGIPPVDEGYPSQLELLHSRFPIPPKLEIERKMDEESLHAWTTAWREMAEILERPELADLWNVLGLEHTST